MEYLIFLIVAIILYYLTGWLVDLIESFLGRQLENRPIYFLFIMLILTIISFRLIQIYVAPPA